MFLKQCCFNESGPEEIFWLSYKSDLLLNSVKFFWNMPLHFDTFYSSDLVCSEVTELGQLLNIALDLQNKFWSSAHIS